MDYRKGEIGSGQIQNPPIFPPKSYKARENMQYQLLVDIDVSMQT